MVSEVSEASAARLTKQPRATRAEMEHRREELRRIILDDAPMSVRQAFYRAVVAGLLTKDDSGYQKAWRAILDIRRDSRLPYEAIVDNTRWMRKPTTWGSVTEALLDTARFYRRSLWSHNEHRLEVWVESDSIAGSIYDVTAEWDVPLMSCRGYSSETFAYSAAEAWQEDDRVPVVLYVGDHDYEGLKIEGDLRTKLQRFAGHEVTWTRVGVTWEQVEDLDLPGSPPKEATRDWYPFPLAVEAEALPPNLLRQLVGDQIESFVDPGQLTVLRAAEESEREVLVEIVRSMRR